MKPRKSTANNIEIESVGFLAGGGEMAALIADYDWSENPLGPIESWPQSLRTTLGIVLCSRFPMFLFWGPELTCFYNDAFRPSLGNQGKHPEALGQSGHQVWPEIWPTIEPWINQVLLGGEAVYNENQLVPFYRNGHLEEIYWTFCYSAVKDETDTIAGVFVTCTETTNQLQTLRAIEDSKNELSFAIDAADLGTWDMNPFTNRISGNARLNEWFGVPAGMDPDLSQLLNAISAADVIRVEEAIRTALKFESGGQYDIEYTIIHPETKQKRIVNAIGRAWFGKDRVAYRFNGILQDITKEVRARQELETNRAKLESIIAAAPAGIGLFMGRNLVIELANQTFIDIVGKGWGVIGKPLGEAMPELISENQPFLKILDDVFTSGKMFQSFGSQVKIVQNGVMTYNYYNITYTPLFNSEGEVYAILDIAIDVTEEIKAMHRLEESESRFRNMAEDSEILIALSDETSKATYFSKAWTDLTGRPMQDLLEYGWVDLVHPHDRQIYLDVYYRAFEKQVPFSGEFRILNKQGDYRWLLAKGPPRIRPDGSFAGYISSCVDVTELKEAEKSLESKNNQLLRINNDLDNFIYTASHDLKAPMSNIEGLLHHLRDTLKSDDAVNEEADVMLQLMESSINRFKSTILDLTEITKVQKAQELDVQELGLEELIADIKLSIDDKIRESGAEINTDFTAAPTLKFSRKNLKSVIFNLLSNAIKYRNRSTHSLILIKTELTEHHTVLIIQDNGLGIKKANLEKLFTMFKRFHDHVEGTGIGLYIVKRIIDNAGGKIRVDSEEGKGTMFRIYFPR